VFPPRRSYPNVGKSSVINTLISKKSCKVAPIPGETKIWQYITLFRRISLIDCPGVVVDTAGDTETDSVLKGVVRAERLEHPEDFVDAILEKVKREHVAAQYKLPKDGPDTWRDATQLMEMISRRCGRLLKGGDPCLRSAAIMLINDFQRGRLPHYVAPPELKEDIDSEDLNKKKQGNTSVAEARPKSEVEGVVQDLNAVGEEFMHPEEKEKEGSGENSELESPALNADGGERRGEGAGALKTDSGDDEEREEKEGPQNLIGAGEWDD